MPAALVHGRLVLPYVVVVAGAAPGAAVPALLAVLGVAGAAPTAAAAARALAIPLGGYTGRWDHRPETLPEQGCGRRSGA